MSGLWKIFGIRAGTCEPPSSSCGQNNCLPLPKINEDLQGQKVESVRWRQWALALGLTVASGCSPVIKTFEHLKAKAVTGSQTPNTGQQVFPWYIHPRETLISLLLMTFPKKLETSPVYLCGIQSPGHSEKFPEQQKDRVIKETGIYTPKNLDQVTSSHCVTWNLAESCPAGLDHIFVLVQLNPTCIPHKNPILYIFFSS